VLQNPFGAAKPRELVIAQRVGKTEEEILLEDAKKQKLHVSRARLDHPPWLPWIGKDLSS
jgi:hypothetical protein